MAKFDYNLIVLGGGSAGLVASMVGAQARAKVLLVEQDRLGGDCLYTGCIPSKTLIASARVAFMVKHAKEFGVNTTAGEIDYERIMERIRAMIKSIEPKDSIDRYSRLGVDCVIGQAQIADPHTVVVNDRHYSGRSILITTGSKPKIPNIQGLDKSNYVTSDTIWNMESLPQKLMIVGGGAVGCELGQAYARLGSSVTLVEAADRVLPQADREVSDLITSLFEAEGLNLVTNVKIESCSSQSVVFQSNGITKEFNFGQLLIATGRTPVVHGFGLDDLGVELNRHGGLKVNQYLRTSVPSIYACGDVLGANFFTHVAGQQGWFASMNALIRPFWKFKFNDEVIPSAVFTDPEIASVGINESQAIVREIPYTATVYPLSEFDRALTESRTEGFVKLLTVPGRDRLIGASIVSQHAGELIASCVNAMTRGYGTNTILSTIHTYPTWTEALRNTTGQLRRQSAPEFLLRISERTNRWLR
ncbi:MAG: pyridine nucleotide-disulfide oxidoreductase [Gammaproteobacteria bacterium]|nr:pyridine nucleotide-disulfide oxidoreductase [Gammaproteobacteria bacterium]MYF53823.1 pyridine nucleotide-disulfide oxidoreductase [Gammaproteobacteria bacterium]MYK42770.1 pyridine nucleotide-disulfide oxidoreductase [Gammaproteobacteria bacterium]